MRTFVRFSFVLPGIATLLMQSGCGRSPADVPAQKAVPPISVQITHLRRGEITRSITLPGNVLAYQQAILYAKVGGYLKTITVDKGDAVKEGALLADIEAPELLADVTRYKAEADIAALDLKRVSEAQKKAPDLVVPQSVDVARSKYDVAKANLERTQTLLSFTKITAPFAGVVTKRMVDPGAFIPAATSGSAAQNASILTLMDFTKVRVQVAVPEPDVPFIVQGLPVKVSVEELPGRAFDGSVTRFAYALDDATKTMLAEVELANPKGELRPGMYATLKLGVEKHADALLLPLDAVVVEKAGASIFTVADGKAKRIPVKTGFNDSSNVEIVSELKPTDAIIRVGKQTLADGQPVNTAEAK